MFQRSDVWNPISRTLQLLYNIQKLSRDAHEHSARWVRLAEVPMVSCDCQGTFNYMDGSVRHYSTTGFIELRTRDNANPVNALLRIKLSECEVVTREIYQYGFYLAYAPPSRCQEISQACE